MTIIQRGQIAPRFEAKTYEDETVRLEQYQGAKLWLSFYRYASCPLCNYRIHELMARYEDFASAGVRVVGIMHSTPDRIAKHVGKKRPPFPIIADPGRELYKKYGVTQNLLAMFHPRVFTTAFKAMMAGIRMSPPEFPAGMVPADFLIDPEGLVWAAYYGRAVSDHIPFETVARFAADDCLTMPAA